jgi:hypothetical protein
MTLNKEPGYKSWKNINYPKGTKVYVFNKNRIFKGIGELATDFPSKNIMIRFRNTVLFAGEECLWIPCAESKYYRITAKK